MKRAILMYIVLAVVSVSNACRKGPTPTVEKPIRVGVPETLCQAARAGDIVQVRSLISSGLDVNVRCQGLWTPLHHAAVMGRKDVVELLITKGAKIGARDKWDRTPLLLAAGIQGGVAELLVAEGADVNATDVSGDTPLLAALRSENEGLAELLITKGADVNVPIWPPPGDSPAVITQTPLHYAARLGYKKVAALLISKGADVNAKTKTAYAETPMDIAFGAGHTDIVELLRRNGGEFNVKSKADAKGTG